MNCKRSRAGKDPWAASTWEGSLRDQVRRWSRLTFDEILEWQEEAAKRTRRVRSGATRASNRTAPGRKIL